MDPGLASTPVRGVAMPAGARERDRDSDFPTPNRPKGSDTQLLVLTNDNKLRLPLNPHPVESLPKLLPPHS
jgi:hypothetical protein